MIEFIDAYSEKWDFYLNEFGKEKLDIYYTKEYCRLYETNVSKAYLFVYKEKNKIGIYPMMKTLITGYKEVQNYYDIETPYGYGGPLVNTDDEIFIDEFEENFIDFCANNRIIAEFIRFHPVLENVNIFKNNIDINLNRRTIVVELDKGIDRIWKEDISSKNRNMIRKAVKNGLEIEITKEYRSFMDIYDETMKKVHASSFYFFNEEYYKGIMKINNINIFNVKFRDEIIASAIFMKYNRHFHYHLAGSKKKYLNMAPNNFLLWEAIKYASNAGCSDFHLGGGTDSSLNDSLYKFKKSFSKNERKFFIGKRAHNTEIYNELLEVWKRKNNINPKLFLQYKEK